MQNPLASTTDVTALQAVIVALRQENEYLRGSWQRLGARVLVVVASVAICSINYRCTRKSRSGSGRVKLTSV